MTDDDHHYCPTCGASDAFCGCPDSDPHTMDTMQCPHCGGTWRRRYDSTSTTCLHPRCHKDGSTVTTHIGPWCDAAEPTAAGDPA